jgi:hypothetical protein
VLHTSDMADSSFRIKFQGFRVSKFQGFEKQWSDARIRGWNLCELIVNLRA